MVHAKNEFVDYFYIFLSLGCRPASWIARVIA